MIVHAGGADEIEMRGMTQGSMDLQADFRTAGKNQEALAH
jgi:hypothetical protein